MKKLSVVLGLFCALSAHATEYLTNPDGSDFYIKSFGETAGLSISKDGRYITFGNNLFDRLYNQKEKLFPSEYNELSPNSSVVMSSDAKHFVWNSSEKGFQRLNVNDGTVDDLSYYNGKKLSVTKFSLSGDGSCMAFYGSAKYIFGIDNGVNVLKYCFDDKTLDMMPATDNGLVNHYSVRMSDDSSVVSYGPSGLTDYGYNIPFLDKVYVYKDQQLITANTGKAGYFYTAVSGNGKYVFYSTLSVENGSYKQNGVYVLDTILKKYFPLEVIVNGEKKIIYAMGDGMASSGDGRYFVFISNNSYVDEDLDSSDVYVYDQLLSEVKIIPKSNFSGPLVLNTKPVISLDGRHIAFIAEDRTSNIGTSDWPVYKTRVVTARNPFLDDDTFCKAY